MKSAIVHAIYAIIMQVFLWGIIPNLWVGAAFASGFFIAREHTQAEYRWIAKFGKGKRSNLPEFGGFDMRVWGKVDDWLDWLFPVVAVITIAIIF